MLYQAEDYEAILRVYKDHNFRGSDWFGGIYFDDHGEICVKFVEDRCEKSFRDEILKLTNGKIYFEKGKYTYRDLSGSCAEILNDPESVKRGIAGAGIDEKNNRITLAVTNDFRDENSLYENDKFLIEHFDWLKPNTSIQPADELSSGKCFFSAGYPAKNDKGVHGVITAGHLSDIEKEMPVLCDGNEIGCIGDFEFSDVMDAAFIELNGSVKCSDIISAAPDTHINGLAPEFICGAAVEMYSANNKEARTGRVVYPSFDFMNFKNITVFSYTASAGNSGAPVLIPYPSGEHGLAGIHLGTLSFNGTVYSYGRTAKSINKRFSLELDI